MLISQTEENYLKAIFQLSLLEEGKISNLAIAQNLNINPATVTEMLKKLAEKQWIDYSRTGGANLTENGRLLALRVVRKHRLWETFLVKNLNFSWDEVHEVAEQLEHIQSEKLLDQLDAFLGFPKFDPHGDPIPDHLGNFPVSNAILLSDCQVGEQRQIVAVANRNPTFLQFLTKLGIGIAESILIEDINEFDRSMNVCLGGNKKTVFSAEVCQSLWVL